MVEKNANSIWQYKTIDSSTCMHRRVDADYYLMYYNTNKLKNMQTNLLQNSMFESYFRMLTVILVSDLFSIAYQTKVLKFSSSFFKYFF